MNENPLVCICIPNYNNENTLQETIDSVLNQTYDNFIIKIIDNASTDKSIEILKNYENKYKNIKLFINEKNIGGEANFDKCFEHSEGKYTAVFHSDDVYDSQIIEKQVNFLENHTNCDAVATHARFIDKHSKIIGEHFIPPEIKEFTNHIFEFIDLFKITLKHGNIITCPSVMSRTEIIKNKIKVWDFKNFKTSADFDVWLRLSQNAGFGFINEPLINYRISDASYSYKHNRLATNIFDMFLVFEKYLENKNINKYLSKSDYDNYYFQYNKACLSVNINRYLLNKKEFIKLKPLKFMFNKKHLKLYSIYLIFNIIKYIKLPNKIKDSLINKKVNGKWFQ